MAEGLEFAIQRQMLYTADRCNFLGDPHRKLHYEHVQVMCPAFYADVITGKHTSKLRIVYVVRLQDHLDSFVRVAVRNESAKIGSKFVADEWIVLLNVDPCKTVF